MFTMAAQSMGYKVAVLDPGADSPAGSVADRHVRADYLDAAGLGKLARLCAAVTTEFENVPAEALRQLAQHCVVSPAADSVAIAQNRISEKRFVTSCGIAVAPYQALESEQDLASIAGHLLPGILKVARLGYDGKGQHRVQDRAELAMAYNSVGRVPCVLEQALALQLECSVIVARGRDGRSVTYPVAENLHSGGILARSVVPARIDERHAAAARAVAHCLANQLDYVGVLCVEFFIAGGELLVNELAPRPHNSGHYSIDACFTSQFEQQARILAGLPLGDPSQHTPAVMLNILGDAWALGTPDWIQVLREGRAKLHLYGKSNARPGRKMGHVTCLGDTLDAALALAERLRPVVAQ